MAAWLIGCKGKSEKFLLHVAQTNLKMLLRHHQQTQDMQWAESRRWEKEGKGRTKGDSWQVLSPGWTRVRFRTLPPHPPPPIPHAHPAPTRQKLRGGAQDSHADRAGFTSQFH